jgi:hypothetical protein
MRGILLLVGLVLINNHCLAQWQSIGYFDQGASAFCEDTTNDLFYIAGNFKFYENDTVFGVGYWDGYSMHSMGCGFDWDCTPEGFGNSVTPTNGLIIFQNTLYATGQIRTADGKTINGITFWDGIEWQPLGTGLKSYVNTQGISFGATILSDTLYVYGAFDSIAGVEAHGLAKFDGIQWSAVHSLPQFESYNNPNFIFAVAFYNNELYIAGNFNNPPDYTINDLAKWNGTEWVGVGNLVENSAIYNMLIYKNELYVSGDFNTLGNPQIQAHSIARFDGNSWKTVGGGTDYQINDMRVFGDYLYIAGAFDHVDGLPIDGIARWDGSRWCGYNSHFDNALSAVGMFHDTLYIGGGFWTINGDSSLRKIVRWTGGDSLIQCGNPVGVNEVTPHEPSFFVYPNPTDDQIHLFFKYSQSTTTVFEITDLMGKHLLSKAIDTFNPIIDVSALPAGVYFASITQKGKMIWNEKVVVVH